LRRTAASSLAEIANAKSVDSHERPAIYRWAAMAGKT